MFIMAGIHKKLDCQNSKQAKTMIWVCTVCLGLFGKQLVFAILEHLP